MSKQKTFFTSVLLLLFTGSNFPFNGYVACIDIDEDNADKIFVVFSNYGIQSIFYSDDAGDTWEHVSGNLEEYPDGSGNGPSVRWLKSLTFEENTVYFTGTSVGLYSTTSLDGDNTIWIHEGAETIGTIMVDMIDARSLDGFTAIATQGNGIYSTYYDASASIDETSNASGKINISNSPNPFQNQTTLSYRIKHEGNVRLALFDINGRLIKKLFDGYKQKGDHEYKLNATNLFAGIYLVRITSNNSTDYHKIIKTY